MKKNVTEFIEPEHRFCPICDEEIVEGSILHKCKKKKIKELEKRSKNFNDEHSEEERTYDDKLKESNNYNNDNYYDSDIEE